MQKELKEINKTLKEILKEIKILNKEDSKKEEFSEEEFFEKAKKVVIEKRRVSTTLLQKELEIGYPKASKLMDMLEKEKIVSLPNKQGAREVL